MSITIGVDIGGSHISSAAVESENFKIIPGTYFSGAVNSKASKDVIIKKWGEIINKTIKEIDTNQTIGIAFSMPGPFQYETGIAMFKDNDKYESLYNICISEELLKLLIVKDVSFRFLNDASCFGVGSSLIQEPLFVKEKIIAITLGTGFGASFLNERLPITTGNTVPHNGCLWDKPFKASIGDNYFSTRWFLGQYEKYTGEKLKDGVKEIASIQNEYTSIIFEEFANNVSDFLFPFLVEFDADLLVLGGNIARCHQLFLPKITQNLKIKNVNLPIIIIENTEETSIIGSTYLFNEVFWKKIKEELPYF